MYEVCKNKAEGTIKTYTKSLQQYSKFTNQTLHELIEEAKKEQDKSLTNSQIILSKKISDFQEYLKNTTYTNQWNQTNKYKPLTINTKIAKVTAFYRHFYIIVPSIKKVKNTNKEKSSDDVTLEEYTEVLQNTSNKRHKAVVSHMGSSAIPTDDIVEFKQGDLVVATNAYHNYDDINDVVPYLLKLNKPIIPTWNYIRGKTGVETITFQSSESLRYLLEYLDSRIYLDNDDKLYGLKSKGVIGVFTRINERFGFGKNSSGRLHFHAHSMRSFFANQLLASDVDSLVIDFMMAHSIPETTAAYFKAKPKDLKNKYIRAMGNVSSTPVKVTDIKSPDYIKLEQENQKLKANVNDYAEKAVNQMVDDILSKKIDENLEDKIRNYNKIK